MPLDPQANARVVLADDLTSLFVIADPMVLSHWAGRDLEAVVGSNPGSELLREFDVTADVTA